MANSIGIFALTDWQLQAKLIGQLVVIRLNLDIAIWEHDGGDAAIAPVDFSHVRFGFSVAIDVDPFIGDLVLLEKSPGPAAIPAPI